MNLRKHWIGHQFQQQCLKPNLSGHKLLERGKDHHQPNRGNLMVISAMHQVHLFPTKSYPEVPSRSSIVRRYKCSTIIQNITTNVTDLPFAAFSLPFAFSWTSEIQRMKSKNQALIIQEPSQQNLGKNEE